MRRRDQDLRDLRIAADAASGMRQRELALRYSVCERTVGRALANSRRSPAGPSLERLGQRWHQIEEAIDELAQLRGSATPSAAVAAIRTQVELIQERTKILQDLGLVPRHSDLGSVETFARQLIAASEEGLDSAAGAWLRGSIERLLHDRDLG